MAAVVWTDEARSWLREIHDYIARDNSFAAQRTVNGILQKAAHLAKFPELGYRFAAVPDREVRILLYGHYRIAYEVAESKQVRILGVFHGALDIKRFLKE